MTAPDADAAARLVAQGTLRPDLVLADFNLPGEMNGLALATLLRARLRRQVPVIILTGDISTGTLRDIADADCMRISKPVRPAGADGRDPETAAAAGRGPSWSAG